MAIAANLGYPRIGRRRELKRALEDYWSGKSDAQTLLAAARDVRHEGWLAQQAAGIDRIPANDFSLYDHMLDAAIALGAVPERYRAADALATYFAMARGDTHRNLTALEMTKWFDTNYHYIVPELSTPFASRPDASKLLAEVDEARALGIDAQPVLVGPLTFVLLTAHAAGANRLATLDGVGAGYAELLRRLAVHGLTRVQLDEPALVLDLDDEILAAYGRVYRDLAAAAPQLRVTLATYFGPLPARQLATVLALPIDVLHLDLTRGPQPLKEILGGLGAGVTLSLGIVDGRNVWRTDLTKALTKLEGVAARLGGDRLIVAPSCSLLHVPHDLDGETGLDGELRSWLAFGKEKLHEIRVLTDGINRGRASIAGELAGSAQALQSRASSSRVHDPKVASRMAGINANALARRHAFPVRSEIQRRRLGLPLLPTTTIGSFPQGREVRKARADFRAQRIDRAAYDRFLRTETERTIRLQEEIGLDVLVHGEFERTDMVEYFGERLDGFAHTMFGWVQSYGSRCVKPPIIFGDVVRRRPMTVEWSTFAQALTGKPVKGMLTGPVTILQWSFVRDDQSRAATAAQIALAIRDEVADLEAAGIGVIQIDEPALREGLPLRASDRPAYLRWAVDAFRLASSGVDDGTQIHTHMCYGDFNDIMDAIVALDADVISMEASRSSFALLQDLAEVKYPNQVGPGVYDINSPRVPGEAEIAALIERMVAQIPVGRVWVNPDCGLKTRDWPETEAALRAMVVAARKERAVYGAGVEAPGGT
ncbi:5-methyltetrahydropteroyltriglutamate--homocysteine S-methyltransferase [bacterium]|nr:MAG: 5-methyltetrahydropteroyltriglutamate--homocysteine S-methyltransferase [bacterium]